LLRSESDGGSVSPRTRKKKAAQPAAGYHYDSDSSDEGGDAKPSVSTQPQKLQPLVLPFPESVAEQEKPLPVPSAGPGDDVTTVVAGSSLFASVNDPQALQDEASRWFLFQLPTRLPPVQQREDVMAVEPPDTAEVATPPVQADSFDNALINAKPGRLGKIKVYRSGKTVLVLQCGAEGAVELSLTEGLSCAFQQVAVAVDAEKGEYVQLGTVGKTVVATPDLSRAFDVATTTANQSGMI
jgi:hypothetical protein